jgi:hypothetical protein
MRQMYKRDTFFVDYKYLFYRLLIWSKDWGLLRHPWLWLDCTPFIIERFYFSKAQWLLCIHTILKDFSNLSANDIYCFRAIPRIKRDYFPKQPWPNGDFNGNAVFILWGRNWIFHIIWMTFRLQIVKQRKYENCTRRKGVLPLKFDSILLH